MCLTTTQIVPKAAEARIPCFKLVKKSWWTKEYITPFQHSEVKLNTRYTANLEAQSTIFMGQGKYAILEGLHTFGTLEGALRTAMLLGMGDSCRIFTILKAEIPTGALYYEGDFEGMGLSYVSDVVYYGKKVPFMRLRKFIYRLKLLLK